MKILADHRLLYLAVGLFVAQPAWTQTGTVTYVHTLQFDVDLPAEMQQFAQYMPENITTTYEMGFNETASLTSKAVDEVKPARGKKLSDTDGLTFKFNFSGGSDVATAVTYVDIDEGRYVEQRDFMGRTFLVSGDLPELAWKLSGEEGQMLERRVLKATAMMDTSVVEAWFTPEIPSSLGPGQFGGLPGIILMLSVDAGQQLYEATAIDLSATPSITPPEKGREVTQEEFDAIMEEKLEEVKQNVGGNFNVIFRGN